MVGYGYGFTWSLCLSNNVVAISSRIVQLP